MNKISYTLPLCVVLLSPIAYAIDMNNTLKTAAYFESIKNDPEQVLLFLEDMPKGGDLHTHLAGATYAENIIKYGSNTNLCVNSKTDTLENAANCNPNELLKNLSQNSDLYNQVINAWSMRSFISHADESGHDHFFNTFMKFDPVVRNNNGKILAEMAARAANQHEDYLEPMVTFDNNDAGKLGLKLGWDNNFAEMQKKLLSNGFANVVNYSNEQLATMETTMRQQLQCDSPHANPGCQMTIRYLYQVLRGQQPAAVFSQIMLGFELAAKNPKVVGINLVMPEDGFYSMRDYDLHMQMIHYFKQQYPQVHVSLHAGELALGLVPPKGLTFHINNAINIADAERIGHGVDIAEENNAAQLLREMANKHIMVEINLTSNADILNVKGKAHPLPLYLHYHVPVALSTDDEGVLRTDLTREYQRAVETYHFSYPQLKTFARNSITYSFLPGKSLWQDADNGVLVSACSGDSVGTAKPAASCQQFLVSNLKAEMQWKLEQEFNAFESKTLS